MALGTVHHIVEFGAGSDDLFSSVPNARQLFKGISIPYQLVLGEGKSDEAQAKPVNSLSVKNRLSHSHNSLHTVYSRVVAGGYAVHSTRTESLLGSSPTER